jgi:hypothetical protein
MKGATYKSLEHLAEGHVLAVEESRGPEEHKELGPVSVFAVIGHGHNAAAGVADHEVLIVEPVPVDADS